MNDQALKDIVSAVAAAASLASEAAAGFQFEEITQIIALIQGIPGLIAEAPAVLSQWLNLTDAGRADMVADIATIKFPASLAAQDVIQKILDVAVALSAAAVFVKAEATKAK